MITVRPAESPMDRNRVFRLRYEICVEELKQDHLHADHEKRALYDPYDQTAHLLLAEDDGHLVGTIRVNFRREGPLEHEDLYGLEPFEEFAPGGLSMTSRLMVRESHRQSTVAAKLVMSSYELGLRSGIQFDFIHCSPHLVRLYQQLGHRIYRPTLQHPEHGTVIPMVMALDDLVYFERIQSPLRRLQQSHPCDSGSGGFFQDQYASYASIVPTFVQSGKQLMSLWQSDLERGQKGTEDTLLSLFDREESSYVLSQFDSLNYDTGDLIVQQGEESHGMFLLLSGSAAVVATGEETEETKLDILYSGDLFGEMGFVSESRRNATVRAEEPTRVLFLGRSEFEELKGSRPDLAIKILSHLFSHVVRRFDRVQEGWLSLQEKSSSPLTPKKKRLSDEIPSTAASG